MKRSFAIGAALAATLTFAVAAPGDLTAAPAESAVTTVAAGTGAQALLVKYNYLHVSTDGRFLEPCLDVLRGLRLTSFITGRVYAEFTFEYTSRGEDVTKTAYVALRDFEVEGHTQWHTAPQGYQELDATVDLGDARIDEAQDIDTSVRIVTRTGNKYVGVPGSATFTRHVDAEDLEQLPQ